MTARAHLYLWQKRVGTEWMKRHEDSLQERFGSRMAVVELPDHKRSILEISFPDRREVNRFIAELGGRSAPISADWRKWIAPCRPKSIRVGPRLFVTNEAGVRPPPKLPVGRPGRISRAAPRLLAIPAAGAFGTGEHATTAMCLSLLERRTRSLAPGWRVLDCGTGSGILALASYCFGARTIVAIDSDPRAILTAQENARLNQIRGIKFHLGDAVRWRRPGRFDVIVANLYSEILHQAMTMFQKKLARDGQLIVSGVLRSQEPALVRTLRENCFDILEIRRRGKWIAVLASRRQKRLR